NAQPVAGTGGVLAESPAVNWLAITSACPPPVCPGCRVIFGRNTQAVIETGASPDTSMPGNFSGARPSNFNDAIPVQGEASPTVRPGSSGSELSVSARRTRTALSPAETASTSASPRGSPTFRRPADDRHVSNGAFGAAIAAFILDRRDFRSASSSSHFARSRSWGTVTIGGGSGRLLSITRSVVLLKNASSA